MKLKRLYDLQYDNKSGVDVKESLLYPYLPVFDNYISNVSLKFDKIGDLSTRVVIFIGDTILEETTFLRKGTCVYRLNNFKNVAYPYGEYPILRIVLEGEEIPVVYVVHYKKYNYEPFIRMAIKLTGACVSLIHNKYKFMKFTDKPYFMKAKEKNKPSRLTRPLPISGSNSVVLECHYFDLIVADKKYEHLKNMLNPPILGRYTTTLAVNNLIALDKMNRGYTIIVKSDRADVLLESLSKDYPKYTFHKHIREFHDDYGVSYDAVKALVRFLYRARYPKRKLLPASEKNNIGSTAVDRTADIKGVDNTFEFESYSAVNRSVDRAVDGVVDNKVDRPIDTKVYNTRPNSKLNPYADLDEFM
jgi:hypothetical protein